MMIREDYIAFTETFIVEALAPFDFDVSAQIFSNGSTRNRQSLGVRWKGLAAFYLIIAEAKGIRV